MSASAVLVRLYPPAIRERWGSDIADEVDLAGARSWFNTVVGAGKLWLRPGDWPETVAGQTSRVVATALVAVGVAVTLSLRAAGAGPLTANVDHPASSAWLIPILAGGNHRYHRAYYMCWLRNNNRGWPDKYEGHPKAVYIREDDVLDAVSRFFADRVFGPHRRTILAADLAGVDDHAAEAR